MVACRAGTARRDQALLRQKGICNRLPTTGPEFKAEFQSEFNDALLVTYRRADAGTLKEAMSKFNTIQSRIARCLRKGLVVVPALEKGWLDQ